MKLLKEVELVKGFQGLDGKKVNAVVLRVSLIRYVSRWAHCFSREFPELIDKDTLTEKADLGARICLARNIKQMRKEFRQELED